MDGIKARGSLVLTEAEVGAVGPAPSPEPVFMSTVFTSNGDRVFRNRRETMADDGRYLRGIYEADIVVPTGTRHSVTNSESAVDKTADRLRPSQPAEQRANQRVS